MISGLRAWLIAYDVADPRRLQRVHHFLLKQAIPVQFSLFAGVFSDQRLRATFLASAAFLNSSHDDLRAYPLPKLCDSTLFGPGAAPGGISLPSPGTPLWRILQGGRFF